MNKLATIKRYKYLPFDIGSLKILTQGTIKFTKPSEFNDLFDCDPDHETDNIGQFIENRPDLVQRVAEYLRLPESQLCDEKPKMIERLRGAINGGAFGQPASDNVGICCLTRDPLNLLMWAHYANNHKGYVVEFDIPVESYDKPESEVAFFELLIPNEVHYCNNKPIVNFNDSNDQKLEKQFLVKAKDWEYEKEERVVDFIRKDGIHRYDRKIILHSVIAGARMEKSDYGLLETIIQRLNQEIGTNVNIYKANKEKGAFKLFVEGRPDLKPGGAE